MRTILQILAKYSNFLVFILLEVVAFLLFVTNNPYPRSRMMTTTNGWVAWQVSQVKDIESYFHLRTVNNELAQENALLRDSLTRLLQWQEQATEQGLVFPDLPYEYSHLQLRYIPARVVHISRHLSRPFLTINKGARDSIAVGMGVRSKDGVVGIVTTVSEHYSLVMPLFHRLSRLSCRLSLSRQIGTLVWTGGSHRNVELQDVATHIEVHEGDRIETSGLTVAFPAGIPVGTVTHVDVQPGATYYKIQVQPTTDFERLDYVQVITNALATEQNELNERMD